MTENEKLRALLAEARECVRVNCPCCGKANCPEGSEPELSQRIDAALAEPGVDDYKRGAEAMREAAASCVGGDIALLQTYRSVLERRIRDLPVPEER